MGHTDDLHDLKTAKERERSRRVVGGAEVLRELALLTSVSFGDSVLGGN